MAENTPNIVGRIAVKALTTKMVCTACKRSFVILRGGELECGECENCSNTSFYTQKARPWGHKHRFWNSWVRHIWSIDDRNQITEDTLKILMAGDDISEWLCLAPVAPIGGDSPAL